MTLEEMKGRILELGAAFTNEVHEELGYQYRESECKAEQARITRLVEILGACLSYRQACLDEEG